MSQKLRLTEIFMLHFQELKNATNDSPKSLISFFRDKPKYRELVDKVKRSADLIDHFGNIRKIPHPNRKLTQLTVVNSLEYV